mgnify:CR=1 FL=1
MPLILLLLILLNLIAFIAFGYDKQLAKNRKNRISERSLFLLLFLGGTIGGILGMLIFRHKTSKKSFLAKLFLIILLQIGFVFAYSKITL